MEEEVFFQDWVPIKAICEKLGMSADWQRAKLKKAGNFERQIHRKSGRDGKQYKMVCIRREDVERYIEFARNYERGPYKKRRER